jgi:hypothetical protein
VQDAPSVIASDPRVRSQVRSPGASNPEQRRLPDCFVRLAALGFLAMTVWRKRSRIGACPHDLWAARHEAREYAPPIHLEPGVLSWLTTHAQSKGKTLNALVNELLKKDIELIEAAK